MRREKAFLADPEFFTTVAAAVYPRSERNIPGGRGRLQDWEYLGFLQKYQVGNDKVSMSVSKMIRINEGDADHT